MTTTAALRSVFNSESRWPFSLHQAHLTRCQDFLNGGSDGPRILRVSGASGSGKSFLVRELMVAASEADDAGVGLYVDVPAAELEASAIIDRVDDLLSTPAAASRDAPSFVNRKAARAWIKSKRDRASRNANFGYGVARDLSELIPFVGPVVKALLPRDVKLRRSPVGGPSPIRFLMKRTRNRPVVLAIDNTQFLPFSLRETLETELQHAGPNLRLVLIERIYGGPALDWDPAVPNAQILDMELGTASKEEVAELVAQVLPDTEDVAELAATIHRRSEGNLKSVWFQLRLISSRRESQDSTPTTYEEVIQSLPTLDQLLLRLVVFTVGGLTIANLTSLLSVSEPRPSHDAVVNAIRDLAALGLLVINGDRSDRVRVEHELVAHIVSEATPEEEKLELRAEVVAALSQVLNEGVDPDDEAILQDRLLGIVHGSELRQTPSLMAHLVRFIQQQSDLERHGYLASICRDSACWDVLEVLPEATVRSLLDAVQKTSLFSFGLIAAAKLRQPGGLHEALASLYEAKFLVQLFRYEEAQRALARAGDSKESRAVAFNIVLGLAHDDEAAEIAMQVYAELGSGPRSEQDYVVLRNSVHLFDSDDAADLIQASIDGFHSLGRRFGVATARNNLGIVQLHAGDLDAARSNFEFARQELDSLDSAEVYQPLVNLSALALVVDDLETAQSLLGTAADTVPRSLAQDSAMFTFNDALLQIIETGTVQPDVEQRLASVVEAARKTSDVRFIEVVTWFHASIQAANGSGDVPVETAARIDQYRNGGRVLLELFLPGSANGSPVDLPYLLSPHWRY